MRKHSSWDKGGDTAICVTGPDAPIQSETKQETLEVKRKVTQESDTLSFGKLKLENWHRRVKRENSVEKWVKSRGQHFQEARQQSS